jgi:hypothetical protein
MPATETDWEVWRPSAPEEKEAILRELDAVLASAHFRNSKRYPAFLRFTVEHTLAGESDKLKERTLGIEVFGRQPTYDTNADTVVRYTAGEVRKRLSLYYHPGKGSGFQIALPAGSYVPEFLRITDWAVVADKSRQSESGLAGSIGAIELEPNLDWNQHPAPAPAQVISLPSFSEDVSGRKMPGLNFAIPLILIAVLLGGFYWHRHSVSKLTALDSFWNPVLQEHGTVLLCSGAVVFGPSHFSGTTTASKEDEYSFASMQIVSAVAKISGLLEHRGETYDLQAAPVTPLNDLRDRPIILFGGYNNDWTMRLTAPLRFHFAPVMTHSIVDREQPNVSWARNSQLPYSDSDDYALIARFHDSTTGGEVVVLAGIGRNGSEAAAEFATSPEYMQALADRAGGSLSVKNIEAVVKVSVIDGKTGAPSIQAVHVW